MSVLQEEGASWELRARFVPGTRQPQGSRCGIVHASPRRQALCGGLKVQTLGSRGELRRRNDNEPP